MHQNLIGINSTKTIVVIKKQKVNTFNLMASQMFYKDSCTKLIYHFLKLKTFIRWEEKKIIFRLITKKYKLTKYLNKNF